MGYRKNLIYWYDQDFFKYVYDLFGFTFELNLSTRPEKFLGKIETWDKAEDMLKHALDEFCAENPGSKWELNPEDGAFYGPKIDIKIFDGNKIRLEQQNDFLLP